MSNFLSALETGIYSRLTGGTALIAALGGTLIYDKQAPQSPGSKYVVFQHQGGGDVNESPTRMRDLLYTIRGVATTQAVAFSLDNLIDDLLHNAVLTVSGWTNIQCQRETDINFIEQNTGGANYYHAGAIYRIIIDS